MSQINHWQHYFPQLGENQAFEQATQQTQNAINNLFKNADKAYSGLEPALLKEQINAIDFSQSTPLQEVIDNTNELIAKNSILVQHPHTIAHLHTPPLIASVVAEQFIASLNQSMDSWDQAPAATFVEQKMVDWLCETYQLGEHSDGVFTSGGTQSNLMGLLLARDWFAYQQSQHDVQQDGLPDYAQKMRIICSDKSHFTVQKSASLMGLGERSVVLVKTNVQGQIDINELQLTIDALKAQDLLPFAVVAMAGTTDHGAIDDLQAVVDIARNAGCWSHVDGAYGAALQLSTQHKDRLKGIESADSVSVDFHKLFYQTISCGALLIKNKANFNTLLHHADYLNREGDELPNLVDKSIATTKRFDALKMFMTLKAVGEEKLGEFYDYLLALTQQVANKISENQYFELCCTPLLSTVLFRLSPLVKGDLSEIEFNQLHQQLRLTLLTSGEAVIAETKVDGKLVLKFTLLNPCLTLNDFDTLLDKIEHSTKALINKK
ncbi:L-2,4-diaminobutyrate decarboxylase [Psychromonas sp. RZ22]|uniref:pyridoxal phosphate-dependent decarboxylase family protein n=1 Tax=Psychromonas algarum TaxID=2555643 RepID=UPI0010689A25|nr:aspartate aminotransferase family protein [Psychromonas sp. RZ22]TEW56125.1 L-2,4-diaminobutyrate decarboxylase [Psychromonas sp. RZ22]